MSVKLVQAGDFVTREFPIDADDFIIGREYTCNLRLDHGRISRNHCRILKRGDRVLVEALFSTAGTAVNQKVLDPSHPPMEVHHGDHLWVGPEHFQFAIAIDPDSPSAQPADLPKATTEGLPKNPLIKDVTSVQSRLAHQILERIESAAGAGEELTRSVPESVAESRSESVPDLVPGSGAGAKPLLRGPLAVTEVGGVALVRLLSRAVVADSEIRSITDGLGELIDSGQNCITLDLGSVERMSSQVIGEVFQIYKRCKANGGMLKICQVSPQVAGVFAMTNMQRHIEIFPNEKLALKSLWPRQSSIPKAVIPPLDGRKPTNAPVPASASLCVKLIVEIGRAKGKAVDLRVPRFLIGRDQLCQLRPNSNGISRLHTAIEQRNGRVFVRDLGTQIGTILNDRVLRNEEAEASHGDRLEIEALRFTIEITPREDTPGTEPTDGSLSGLFSAHATDPSADTTIMELPDLSASPLRPDATASTDAPKRPRYLISEVAGDIAVVLLRTPDLSEESVVAALRVELETVLERSGQQHVVVRLDRVKTLSKGAVVMFLARAQHLAQQKGTMRFCEVSAPVMAFLNKTQLPLLIEIYPTLDQAMNTPWDA